MPLRQAPARLADVLDPAHRHPCQIHLDQRFLDRALTSAVALDDRSLKRLCPKLRHLEADVASLGLQTALIMPGAGVQSRLATLVALRIA